MTAAAVSTTAAVLVVATTTAVIEGKIAGGNSGKHCCRLRRDALFG